MPRAILISASQIASDPRVRRQGEALSGEGWSVVSVGYAAAGGVAEPPWETRHVPEPPYEADPMQRSLRIARLVGCRVAPALALDVWRAQARHATLAAVARGLTGDLVIANDYTSLPLAAEIASESGAGLMYDSHEDAAGERPTDSNWRLLYPPYIRAIERRYAPKADIVTTVSEGIAASLQSTYGLRERPAVIRNLPRHRTVSHAPAGDGILVHHHGILVPGRGLELMIASVAHWRPELRLRLRGPVVADYRSSLEARAAAAGVLDRVEFAPPLPFDGLVDGAADADVGLHLLPVFAMPNKVFEYVMAGLMLVTCDLPELSAIVRRYNLGTVLPDLTPKALADVLNGLDRDRLAQHRANALSAARELCWEHEKTRFLELCGLCLDARGRRVA